MSEIFSFIKERIALQLALAVTAALAAAYLLVTSLTQFSYHLLDSYFYNQSYLSEQELLYAAKLQSFADWDKVSSYEIDKFDRFVKDDKSISLLLLKGEQVIYDSDSMTAAVLGAEKDLSEIRASGNYYDYYGDLDNFSLYDIRCADGIVLRAAITSYGFIKYYSWVSNLCLALAFGVFLTIFLFFIRKKVRYIQKLADELQILKGGNLNYSVTEKGRDELYQLASGINQMRLSIAQNQKKEERNRLANQKLVTSLSHDLRTPLTSLIGYLEVMSLKKYQTEEQLSHYLARSQDKAYQIRDLSNKLFEYFLVSQRTVEDYNKEKILTADLLRSLRDNQLFELQSRCFPVICDFNADEFSGACLIDVEFMQRILDNLLSNIRKYADNKSIVRISSKEETGFFLLTFSNKMRRQNQGDFAKGTGIGTKTCEMIMQEHGGCFFCEEQGDAFTAGLTLPLLPQ